MNLMKYKEFIGEFEYDPEARIFHGRVVNIQDTVTFEGTSVEELEQALADSVEDYLEFCKEMGKAPDRPFSGRFNVRLTPTAHRLAAAAAKARGVSLNAFVAGALEREVGQALNGAHLS